MRHADVHPHPNRSAELTAEALPRSRDKLGIFLTLGSMSVLLFHILVNVGMVVGLMPITGIPLPLLSYGGSSMLSTFILLGLIINVRMRRYIY